MGMGIYGFLWLFMGFWVSMGIGGCHGYPWVSMSVYRCYGF